MEKVIIHIVEDNKVIRDSVSKFISFHEEFAIDLVENSADSFLLKNIQHPAEITQILL